MVDQNKLDEERRGVREMPGLVGSAGLRCSDHMRRKWKLLSVDYLIELQ